MLGQFLAFVRRDSQFLSLEFRKNMASRRVLHFWGERSTIDFQAVVRGSRFEINRVEKEEWSLTRWQVGNNSERSGCLSLKCSVNLTMKAVVS
jgi:hypothetical protein